MAPLGPRRVGSSVESSLSRVKGPSAVITGELKTKVDRVWESFWSGGISNPLEVMEQITYLLFIRRLDELHTLEESKALMLKRPMAKRIFPVGKDEKGRDYED